MEEKKEIKWWEKGLDEVWPKDLHLYYPEIKNFIIEVEYKSRKDERERVIEEVRKLTIRQLGHTCDYNCANDFHYEISKISNN